MIKYYELGTDLQLNQIVLIGNHDAKITSGSDTVQTQDLNILQSSCFLSFLRKGLIK